jgi:hypothetical protein
MSTALAERRRAELATLVERHGGAITPAQVVQHAANPESTLHALFTWDDTLAARQWREAQAAKYLRAVVRLIDVPNAQPMTVRAFVSLSTDRGTTCAYRPIEDVLDDETRRANLLADARAELIALQRKYQHLQELHEVWEAVDRSLVAA